MCTLTAIRFARNEGYRGPRNGARSPASAGTPSQPAADRPSRAGDAGPLQLQVIFNRDELRTRSPGVPPCFHRTTAGTMAIMPIDPDAGGTWLAVNEHGLVLALLNLNLAAEDTASPIDALRPKDGWVSRGTVIPALLDVRDADAALARFHDAVDPARCRPFRLAVLHPESRVMHIVRSAVENVQITREDLDAGPAMLTSSGLGDHVVEPKRRSLFTNWFDGLPEMGPRAATASAPATAPAAAAAASASASASAALDDRGFDRWQVRQRELHEHAWPDDRPLSIMMSRADARSVSSAVIAVHERGIVFEYRDLTPEESAGEAALSPESVRVQTLARMPTASDACAHLDRVEQSANNGNGHAVTDRDG